MSDKFLNRTDAPVSDKVWQQIDETVIAAAKTKLNARKLIPIQGPFGFGVKSLQSNDQPFEEKGSVEIMSSCWTPLAMIQTGFRLSARDIAASEQSGTPMDLNNVAKAAMDCAVQEDNLIFYGSETMKLKGLLNTQAALSMNLKSWDNLGAAAEDIMWAVGMLDSEGFNGPYTLGLSANLYNMLFRRYPQGNTEFKHISQFITDGIIKTSAISEGGILLCNCGPGISICLGQDISTGFVGPSGSEYEFLISETVALKLTQPKAVCVLKK